MKGIYIILTAMCVIQSMEAQQAMQRAELEIRDEFMELYKLNADKERFRKNDSIMKHFSMLLQTRETMHYLFDSLTMIGKVMSPDRNLRIINWNIPLKDGTNAYSGYIQLLSDKGEKYTLIPIFSRGGAGNVPTDRELDTEDWYGALYYQIVHNRRKRNDQYILLGIDFKDRYITRKFIEVLTLGDDGSISFGSPVLEVDGKRSYRMVFEYSSQVVMVLQYDPEIGMIVFDHLAPTEPVLKGNYQFYAPDFSHDGMKYKKGIWYFQPDIDVRNQ